MKRDTSKLRYTETHEWVYFHPESKTATVGITDHAQHEISDVVFVELPKEGRRVRPKESVAVIESVKAAFDIYAPMSGEITSVNQNLKNKPELVNQSPYDEGFLFHIQCSDPKEFDSLMTESQYQGVKGASHA